MHALLGSVLKQHMITYWLQSELYVTVVTKRCYRGYQEMLPWLPRDVKWLFNL